MQFVAADMLALWALVVAYFDIRYRRIPNALSLGAWVLAAAAMGRSGLSFTGASLQSVAFATGAALLLTLPAYATGKLGAGDVKYLVAIGLLTSLRLTMISFVLGAFVGGVMVLLWIALPTMVLTMPNRLSGLLGVRIHQWMNIPLHERRMPYGAFLSFGLVVGLWMEHTL